MNRSLGSAFLAFASVLSFASVQPSFADEPARVLPLPLRGPRLLPNAATRVHHAVFGTIVSLAAKEFVLRTRAGRTITVDPSAAVASGAYSAPLFVGKTVLLSGTTDGLGVFHATSVTRMTRINEGTPGDT